jgi:hypothetical protein
MSAPQRGTQTLVGLMSWVFARPSLTAIEVAWRWSFGLPLLLACWIEAHKILGELRPSAVGLSNFDAQNPWVAAGQLSNACAIYQPRVAAVLLWLLPAAAVAWVIASGIGRGLVMRRMEPSLRLRPFAMMALQAAWLAGFAALCFCWLRSVQWAAATHITPKAEPDLVGLSIWVIFLSLGFFTAWALTSWALSVAPLLMLLEGRSALSALGESLRLGRAMTGKLVEINMVMGIVKLALLVLAMVLAAAPLPFSDQLGPEAMRGAWAVATIFYLVASDYFQVVRLKGFQEFWKLHHGTC